MTRTHTATPRAFLVSIGIWIVGALIASQLMDAESANVRGFGVLIGVASMVPWGRVAIGGAREADEFTRQIHVRALVIAFGGVTLSVTLIDWLQRAGFVGALRFGGLGLLGVLLWWGVGMVASTRHYR